MAVKKPILGHMKKLASLITTIMILSVLGYANMLSVLGQSIAEQSQTNFNSNSSTGFQINQSQVNRPQDGLDENVKASSFAKDGINAGEVIPPVPPPLAVSLPTIERNNIPAELSLNWRCRALALANEYPVKKDSIVWDLPVNYKQGQELLKRTIKKMGLTLLSEYDDSGQFLLSLPVSPTLPVMNAKGDIIIVSQPVNDTNTLFKMHVYLNHGSNEIRTINCLPDVMTDLLERHEL